MGKHHSPEVKRAAVARILAGERPMAVSRSIGVSNTSSIYKWIEQFKGSAKPNATKPRKQPSGTPALLPVPQVIVAQPTRQHRGPPSAFSNKDTRQYLLMWEQSLLAGIRDGRIKNLRDNPEIVLALNALVASQGGEE